MNYFERAVEMKEELVAHRRYLHEHPELHFDLPVTTQYVWDRLKEMGYTPRKYGLSGISATVGREGGKVFLLRADMDALPMREESGLPFSSKVDRAHACGHDLHTAMLLGAARLLKENEGSLDGRVKLMFQPAEEILEGAKSMLRAGILENPRVDAAMGLHVLPQAPVGFIGYNTGVVSASSDSFTITVYGKGGHGAQPNEAVDPINVGAHIHLALQELIAREVNPEEAVVLTIGAFQAGEAHNIIPETALLKGTLRTFNREIRDFMLKRIQEAAFSTAQAFRATAEFAVFASTGSVLVDPDVAEVIAPALVDLFGEKSVVKVDQRISGSEDFSEVTERVPSMFLAIGAGAGEEGSAFGLHNPKVVFDEDSLPIGAAAYAHAATEWLREDGAIRITPNPCMNAGVLEEPPERKRTRQTTGCPAKPVTVSSKGGWQGAPELRMQGDTKPSKASRCAGQIRPK